MFVLKKPKKVCGYHLGDFTFYFAYHKGTDFCAYYEPLYAPEDGQIVKQVSGWQGGLWLWFKGKSGILYKFAHLSKYYYKTGNHIPEGEVIAKTGNTGKLTKGAHLHMEMWKDGKQINPEFFNFLNNKIMVDKEKLNQIYQELLCRLPDEEAKGYLGIPEDEVRALIGKSEERMLIINLINKARQLN